MRICGKKTAVTAQKEIDKARSLGYPSVSLAGNYEINTETFDSTASNYTVGAVVSVPLFTGGQISAKIREAGMNLKQTQSMLRAIGQQVRAETRQAYFNAQSAWARIRVAWAAAETELNRVQINFNPKQEPWPQGQVSVKRLCHLYGSI